MHPIACVGALRIFGIPCMATPTANFPDTVTVRTKFEVWKRVYDFLLGRNSNLHPILHRFGDIAGFFALPGDPTPILPQFWGVPVAPDGPCWGQPEQRP